jgi:NAD(P)-dependent dehydrogenase (short-subunit alcohol dehydrogenase family)
MALILLTNVTQFAGPGGLEALLSDGHRVLCHDSAFIEEDARRGFLDGNHGDVPLSGVSPIDIHEEVRRHHGLPDAIVLNDVHPNHPTAIESTLDDDWTHAFQALVLQPVRLAKLFLADMKARRHGTFVFVTSARPARPEPGFAIATTLRAATTAFAKALAAEGAPFGIQANVVAPNYLYSEQYYPRAQFVDDPVGRDLIARQVPFGRLGEQAEVGALIAFLASGRSPFTTGQVVDFTGGWS